MAEKRTTKAEGEKAESAPSAPVEATFSQEQLIASGASALDAPAHAIAGALYDVKKDPITLDEAQRAVNKYLDR